MKEKELRENTTCGICNSKIGKASMPMFYTLELQGYSLNARALERQQRLAMMLGSAYLAQVMGADEDLATKQGEKIKISVCWDCINKNTKVIDLIIK